MRGRLNMHKEGHIIFLSEPIPDGQGGFTQTRNTYLTQFVSMLPSSGSKNIEGYQQGQNSTFNCQMILPATGIPSELDLLNVEGKDYAISNAYIDDSGRVKQLKFTATIRT